MITLTEKYCKYLCKTFCTVVCVFSDTTCTTCAARGQEKAFWGKSTMDNGDDLISDDVISAKLGLSCPCSPVCLVTQ